MARAMAKAQQAGDARARLSPDGLALILWLGFLAASLLLNRDAIANLTFADPDNAMRLVQVRDLGAGQNWFDTTQYRVDPAGGGGPTHWSRFIDAPIAALLGLFGLFVESPVAERAALAAYPPLLALPLLLLFARILQMLGDRASVFFGLAMAATTMSYLHHFAPLNIDHHNWQLLLSVTLLWLALRPPGFGNGFLAALVASIYVEISLEGLPFLGLFWALFVFDWLRDRAAAARLRGFSAGMILLPALWALPFRGPAYFASVFCDSFSLPYILAAALAGAVFLVSLSARPAAPAARLAIVLAAGIAAAAAFALAGPSCLGGPFGELEPFVRTYWYDPIFEGRPLWIQTRARMLAYGVPTAIGAAATLWAWNRTRGRPEGENWTRLALVILSSTIVACLVVRTMAVAHAFMIPAFAATATALWRWADARSSALRRLGGMLLIMLAIPTIDMAIGFGLARLGAGSPAVTGAAPRCLDRAAIALADEPPTLLFSAINIAPTLLVRTPHSVVTTGHHRNHATLHRVLSAFLAPPAVARRLVGESGARYLVFCDEELARLAPGNPHGLAARLLAGERVDWLAPQPRLSSGSFRVFLVRRPAGEGARPQGNAARH